MFFIGVHRALLVQGEEKFAQSSQRQQHMKVKSRVSIFTVGSTVALVLLTVVWDERLPNEHVSTAPSPSALCLLEDTNPQYLKTKSTCVHWKHQEPALIALVQMS